MEPTSDILVSVIVPNYNHACFLQQRLESILAQTYQNIEIILLDDASSDNSKSILETYRSRPLVKDIIYNTENSGSTYRQWQKGFEQCRGEWIWIAESDDWCEGTFLQSLLDEVTPTTNLAFVQSMVVNGNKILWNSNTPQLSQTLSGAQFFNNEMLAGNAVFNASMAIFRRSALKKNDGSFADFKYLGDWAFWGSVAVHGDVFISGKVLNYFRQNESGVSAESLKAGRMYAEYPQLVGYFEKQGFISGIQKGEALKKMYGRLLSNNVMSDATKLEIKRKYASLIAVRPVTLNWQMQQFKINTLRRLGI